MLVALLIFTSGYNSGFQDFEPDCFYLLKNLLLSCPARVLSVSASMEGKARFWLGMFFIKTSFLAGSKFSNNDYKVTYMQKSFSIICRKAFQL